MAFVLANILCPNIPKGSDLFPMTQSNESIVFHRGRTFWEPWESRWVEEPGGKLDDSDMPLVVHVSAPGNSRPGRQTQSTTLWLQRSQETLRKALSHSSQLRWQREVLFINATLLLTGIQFCSLIIFNLMLPV